MCKDMLTCCLAATVAVKWQAEKAVSRNGVKLCQFAPETAFMCMYNVVCKCSAAITEQRVGLQMKCVYYCNPSQLKASHSGLMTHFYLHIQGVGPILLQSLCRFIIMGGKCVH